jgi:ribosomal protein S18 acetylase RimI-like enzyme
VIATLHPDVRVHMATARAFLRDGGVFNMHQLRIGGRTCEQLDSGTKPDALWGITVASEGQVVAAAIYTSRKALFVSPHATQFTPALLSVLPADCGVPDLVGHAETVTRVGARLGTYVPFITGTLYALEDIPRDPATLTVRQATADDHTLLVNWNIAFLCELAMKDPVADVPERVSARLRRGEWFIAEHAGEPIACAGGSLIAEVAYGSIGPVYTLPSARGCGLRAGQAVTAAACAHLRSRGAKTIILLADQFNPVSNAAYLRVGFTPRGDFYHLQRHDEPPRQTAVHQPERK